jgi:hypothetical protein
MLLKNGEQSSAEITTTSSNHERLLARECSGSAESVVRGVAPGRDVLRLSETPGIIGIPRRFVKVIISSSFLIEMEVNFEELPPHARRLVEL